MSVALSVQSNPVLSSSNLMLGTCGCAQSFWVFVRTESYLFMFVLFFFFGTITVQTIIEHSNSTLVLLLFILTTMRNQCLCQMWKWNTFLDTSSRAVLIYPLPKMHDLFVLCGAFFFLFMSSEAFWHTVACVLASCDLETNFQVR